MGWTGDAELLLTVLPLIDPPLDCGSNLWLASRKEQDYEISSFISYEHQSGKTL